MKLYTQMGPSFGCIFLSMSKIVKLSVLKHQSFIVTIISVPYVTHPH